MSENVQPQNKMGTAKMLPLIFSMALPAMFSMMVQALYNIVDTYFVSQVSEKAMAAVSLAFPIQNLQIAFAVGTAVGVTSLISRRLGEGRKTEAESAASHGIVLGLCTAAVFAVYGAFFTTPFFKMFESDPEIVLMGDQYISVCCIFSFGSFVVVMLEKILQATGNMLWPMIFQLVGALINIALDPVFIFGYFGLPAMGVTGAAIATVTAQGISFFASLLYMKKHGLGFPFGRKDIALDRAAAGSILKVGLPLAMQDALVNVSFLVITAIINTLGVVASAAVGVVERIIGFAMLPPGSFASAVATVTAQNMGAGKPERARRGLWCGVGFSLVCGVAVCLYAQLWPETLTAIFSRDPAVITAAAQYLQSYSLDCVLVSFIFSMNSYFSGCGRSVVAFAHSMVATFDVRIPVTYLMSRAPGSSLYKMGLAAPAATLVSLVICLFYLRWFSRRHDFFAKTDKT